MEGDSDKIARGFSRAACARYRRLRVIKPVSRFLIPLLLFVFFFFFYTSLHKARTPPLAIFQIAAASRRYTGPYSFNAVWGLFFVSLRVRAIRDWPKDSRFDFGKLISSSRDPLFVHYISDL